MELSLEKLGGYVRDLVEERLEESLSSRGDKRRDEPDTGSIFRVSEHIRATDPSAYEPKVISIGPYHRNKPHLGAMDQVKQLYLKRYLQRNQAVRLKNYVCHINDELMAPSRSCYFGGLAEMGPSELSAMLLLDGCFILELLLTNYYGRSCNPGVDSSVDPLLGNMSTRTLVEYDLLLLENQLPFFVLESLFDLGGGSDEENSLSLASLFVDFFADYLPPNRKAPRRPPAANFYHLLHIFHSCITDDPSAWTSSQTKKAAMFLLGSSDISRSFHGETDRGQMVSKLMIPCMTDLLSAQVRFKRKDNWNFCNVTFQNGVMEIAPIQLNRHSSSWYRNLIAFEQHFFPAVKSQVTAYVMFLGCLIESESDLAALRRGQVAASSLDSHDAVVFFRKLCRDTIVDYNRTYLSNLMDISNEVRKCYGNNLQQWVAALKTLYFSNPKEFINLFYGVFLVLLLTGIRTFFTVYAYYRPPK